MKYRCSICGSVIEQQEFLDCPMCHANKAFLKEYMEEKTDKLFYHAIQFSEDNKGIEKDDSKCIDCGQCKKTCKEVTGLSFSDQTEQCLSCGQCILTCPSNALKPKSEKRKVLDAMANGKILLCYTSPAVRVSIGDAFGFAPGTFLMEKLVGVLYELGFSYVFDTTFGADLTVMEEAYEFKERFHNNGKFPMITSCCPAWVKYASIHYPELKENISSCRSPIGMQGQMIKNYFSAKINQDPSQLFSVAITPCTAKKMETQEESIKGTDAVLTISEIVEWIKEKKIDFKNVEEKPFSSMFQEGSGGGSLFGISGGVMTSLLRAFYYLETGHYLENYDFSSLHTLEPIKELSFPINGKSIKVAVIQELSKAKSILDAVKNHTSDYQFIEIMNCKGGCIGGGGEPKSLSFNKEMVYQKRMESLIQRDESMPIHTPFENPDIVNIYKDLLVKPNGVLAQKYLHKNSHHEKVR